MCKGSLHYISDRWNCAFRLKWLIDFGKLKGTHERMKDSLGDRMKGYEALTEQRLMPLLPTLARVDGRCFSSFTQGLCRPYDVGLAHAMHETSLQLAKETNASVVYTQSDEITLAWYSPDPQSQIWFDLRHSKMVSQIAAQATLHFYRACQKHLPETYTERLPTFDGRVWQVPTLAEACNAFIWREWDATKNSITMAARSLYSHNELEGKSSAEKQEMLFQRGVNWNDYPVHFKRGFYLQRRKVVRSYTITELSQQLPPKHNGRNNREVVIERTEWEAIDMPPITTVSNLPEVLFQGAKPLSN